MADRTAHLLSLDRRIREALADLVIYLTLYSQPRWSVRATQAGSIICQKLPPLTGLWLL